MPGANYMGGKRNAARARTKDAEGKAQRSHFGKKRFEVLRTGLSKGGAAREVRREPPEISLAHARRAQNGLRDEREWERNWTGLRSPSTSPVLLLRSPPVNTASGRSKILTTLDADDPSVRRAQVEKILQIPDLLGLSKTKGQTPSRKVVRDESWTPHKPVQRQRSSFNRHVSLKSPSVEGSPSLRMDPSHFQRTPSSRSRSRERAIVSSPVHSSHLSSHRAESAFVPMFLDSSPPPCADDSGYAEFWPDPYHDSEPTRVPFYPQSANTNQRHSHVSSVSGRAASLSPTILSRSSSLGTLSQFATLSRTPSRESFHPSASPSHLGLPSLVEAQFVSDMTSPRFTPEPVEPLQLSLSDSSVFSWSELALHSSPGSPDIPQASFSLSPSDFTGLGDAEEGAHYDECPSDARCISTEGSVDSFQDSSVDDASEDIASPSAEEGTVQWDYVCLEDVLGGLFEGADPWNALSELLGLPSAPVGPSGAIEDILAILGTSDRRGVGYTAPGSPPSPANFPTSQTLENAYRETSASWDFASVVSPVGPPLSGGYGHPSAGRRAREAEAEFVRSHMAESIPPHGSYAPPQCSADCRSPPPQPTDRHETVIQANQTVESPKASGNGGDFTSEAVADRRSRCSAFHFERDDDLGLVDGPSLFDDEDPWGSEG